MLYIVEGVVSNIDNAPWKSWHVGTPLPEMKRRVITFQADGDELTVILDALKDAQKER